MQARHTVKLKMNRGCLRKQARGDGWPKWHKELMAAAVRAASIRRQVRPPADLATGVFRLSRRIIAELEIMIRQMAKNKSRAIERGLSQASSRTVLFRHCSLLLGAHSSGRHSWHVVGSEEEKQHRNKEKKLGCKSWNVVFFVQFDRSKIQLWRFKIKCCGLGKKEHGCNFGAFVTFQHSWTFQRRSAPPAGQPHTQQLDITVVMKF